MSKYKSINILTEELNKLNLHFAEDIKELVPLLDLLEKLNPCSQEYELIESNIIVSYSLKLNLLNFRNIFPLKADVQIIGLPVSVCLSGYFGHECAVQKIIEQRKGLKVILNGDSPFKGRGKTLSTFVFENRFSSFDEYLNTLRSSYRRRINKSLRQRENLTIKKLKRQDFSVKHYRLYLSIMNRTENLLETLPIEFFQEYEAELYEFLDKDTNEPIGFIQLKEIRDKLYFLFGGFKKEDNEAYDIYYNMLLKIIEIGIEKGVKDIEFGQTAEESKLKIGCKEKYKYLYIHHSNNLLNFLIQLLVPLFTYETYSVKHHVFKHEDKV
ncbi:MAG: hypothetical protein AB7V48_00045 [Sedimentibacter sp.]